jgi:hypothetical protein
VGGRWIRKASLASSINANLRCGKCADRNGSSVDRKREQESVDLASDGPGDLSTDVSEGPNFDWRELDIDRRQLVA